MNEERGRHADAEALFREGLEIQRKALPEGDWRLALSEHLLGHALVGQRRFDVAESLMARNHPMLMNSTAVWPIWKRQALRRMVDLYEAGVDPSWLRRTVPRSRGSVARPGRFVRCARTTQRNLEPIGARFAS